VDDILFTLFRHKWLILAFFCFGIIAASLMRVTKPPPYVSEAKLMVPYVIEQQGPTAPGANVQLPENSGQSVINTEVEILWSFDVASNAARMVGPERLLSKSGGGNDIGAAAGMISKGLTAEPLPHTAIFTVFYRNTDPNLVQPVLQAVLAAYMQQHIDIHLKKKNQYFQEQAKSLQRQLAEVEEQIKAARAETKVLFPEDDLRKAQDLIGKLEDQFLEAERLLAERKAMMGDEGTSNAGLTNGVSRPVPPEIIDDYTSLMAELSTRKQKTRELFAQGLTELHPAMEALLGQMQKLEVQKAALLTNYPALAQLTVAAPTAGTNSSGGFAADMATIRGLTARVMALRNQLSNAQAQAAAVIQIEPRLAQLARQKAELETNYSVTVAGLNVDRASEVGPGKLLNITPIEQPTPPARDMKKLKKLLMGVFGGCVAAGLGLAFLIDMVLDRSIKRRTDIERHLKLPVLQSIPDTAWNGKTALPWQRSLVPVNGHGENGENSYANGGAIAVWDPVHQLQPYTEGLRERLMTYFEVGNLNAKKPKLVGITACAKGCGVTTVASGLAASLSRVGDGNVLLVDMNGGDGTARAFHEGMPSCGIMGALEPDTRREGQVEANLYMASMSQPATRDKLVKRDPSRFDNIMPQLKASNYEYIIFDLPPVTQSSPTPRFAGYMDLVLFVVESEKTNQQVAARANSLMQEAKANVATVLNKCRQHVPAALAPEL